MPTGTALVYSTYLGGNGNRRTATGIAVDGAGNAYVTGYTTSTNFPTTHGAFQTVHAGGTYDAFVAKLNDTGSGWSTPPIWAAAARTRARALPWTLPATPT